jgi:hypothetical protein
MLADTGFLCDEDAMLWDTVKETLCLHLHLQEEKDMFLIMKI